MEAYNIAIKLESEKAALETSSSFRREHDSPVQQLEERITAQYLLIGRLRGEMRGLSEEHGCCIDACVRRLVREEGGKNDEVGEKKGMMRDLLYPVLGVMDALMDTVSIPLLSGSR